MRIRDLRLLVISHYFATGTAQEFVNYTKPKVRTLAYVEHPFFFSSRMPSSITIYEGGEFRKRIEIPKARVHELILYAQDFLLSIFLPLRAQLKFDLCVAADCLNALSGLILRGIGITKKVVFVTVDYSPNRFRCKVLNGIYHWLDMICCYRCDYVWNSSEVIEEERRRRRIRDGAPQMTVSDGTHFDRIKRLPTDEIDRLKIVFMGHLTENKGVQLVVEALPMILKRVPRACFVIIGGGHMMEKLRERARNLGVENNVVFKDFVQKDEEIEDILSHCSVAVAPYVPDPSSFSRYSDVLKPKIYMAAGLPVVATKVPKIAWEIENRRAGFAIDYDIGQLVETVAALLTDDSLYEEFRRNAIAFGSEFRWNEIFKRALISIGINSD